MRRVALTLFAFAVLLAAAGPASACSCARDPTAASILASATAVFTATVAETKEVRKNVSVTTFRITESFKGPAAQATVVALHPSGSSASCGVKFVAGQTYTLAAHRTEANEDGATLATSQCSTWMFLPHVGLSEGLIEDLRAIRAKP
jgi:hypothetical protein